jgi:hypothetical protein
VPAAAVIPVPIADIEVVAVKKFVVEMLRERCLLARPRSCSVGPFAAHADRPLLVVYHYEQRPPLPCELL